MLEQSPMDPRKSLSLPDKALDTMRGALRELGSLSISTYQLSRSFLPLLKVMVAETEIKGPELTHALDVIFEELYKHPLTRSTGKVTSYLRSKKLLPNEQS